MFLEQFFLTQVYICAATKSTASSAAVPAAAIFDADCGGGPGGPGRPRSGRALGHSSPSFVSFILGPEPRISFLNGSGHHIKCSSPPLAPDPLGHRSLGPKWWLNANAGNSNGHQQRGQATSDGQVQQQGPLSASKSMDSSSHAANKCTSGSNWAIVGSNVQDSSNSARTNSGVITVEPGTDVSLKCTASGSPLPQITWWLDAGPIPESSSRLSVGDYVTAASEVISFVNITAIHVEDGGFYGCQVDGGSLSRVHYGRLNVIGSPRVRNMADRMAVEGLPLAVSCPYSGYPISEITWHHNNRRIPYNHRQKSFANGTLLIDVVDRRNDGGEYKCTVRSDSKSSTQAVSSFRISVQSPPVIDPFAFPRFIEEGSRAKALCSVIKGDSPMTIRWLKDDRPLATSSSDGVTVTTLDEYSSAIVFAKVSLVNRGNYTCTASNLVGAVNYTTRAVIYAHPRWTFEPINTMAVTGRRVIIHCQADGFPDPLIEWKRASSTLDRSSSNYKLLTSDGRLHKLENGSLEILSVTRADTGFYMCQATNGIGSGISTVIELQVRVPASFKEQFRVQTVKKLDPLTVACSAIGDKPLNIRWKKDGQPISSNPAASSQAEARYRMVETITDDGISSQIEVNSADRRDSSLFTCSADNGFGADETNVQVIVQEKPDAPAKPTVVKLESRSVMVNWSPPYSGNSPILYYIVEFKEVADDWPAGAKRQSVPGTETRATLAGLWPGLAYHVRVVAENSMGRSDASPLLHVITELEVPKETPVDIRAEAVGSKSIKVKWKAASHSRHHNLVNGYYIGFKGVHSNDVFTYKTVEISDPLGPYETLISGLQRLTKYIVIVKAFNRKGSGPASEEVLVKTNDIDVPSAPSLELLSTTHKSVELKWDTVDNVKSLSGFTVYRRKESEQWKEFPVNPHLNTFAFRDLLCGTKYQFYLTAYNTAGTGLPSNTVAAKTQGTVPLAPSQSSFIVFNGSHIVLDFGEWRSGGCPITYFSLYYKREESSGWQSFSQSIAGDQDKYLLRDLNTRSLYRLRVTATSEAGSTEAEYVPSSSSLTGGRIDSSSSYGQRPWSGDTSDVQRMKILILPIMATVIVISCISVAVYGFRKKPNHVQIDRNASVKELTSYSEQVPMSDLNIKQSRTNLYEKGISTPKECLYYTSTMDRQFGEAQTLQLHEVTAGQRPLYGHNTKMSSYCNESISDVAGASAATNFTVGGQLGPTLGHGRRSEEHYAVPFLVTKPMEFTSQSFRPTSGHIDKLYSFPSKLNRSANNVSQIEVSSD
ncbi:Down syndrome cell adhesion molecule-like protein Dscam2 [Halotydeus destructor]|nr:Down syndrome cell adhesion molecule-like protein Dscam2 [Halotydeus destructor]